MKILLTGATGYIGKRLLPALIEEGHHIVCCVRDKNRFNPPKSLKNRIDIIEVDFLKRETLDKIPKDIEGAYYLMHSMSTDSNYQSLEKQSAINFREVMSKTSVKHVIYLSGIINDENLSPHLSSRKAVEMELSKGSFPLTTLRAGIIIGSGSASFEIIRDLVEKLPVMIAPKWLSTKCQPIGVRDVISFLTKTLGKKETFDRNFDIGSSDVLTYKEMLIGFAKIRKLKRAFIIVPVMTPKLSSYWLYFVTSTSYKLASSLVDSMKVEVICKTNELNKILGIEPASYEESLKRTLQKIEDNQIVSSWKDSWISGVLEQNISDFIKVPSFGCFKDERTLKVNDMAKAKHKLWTIGGENGWYYANWLWQIRGFIDKVFGGVGLRRGRTSSDKLTPGDPVDFWRVLYANKEEGRLLLYAEMLLPGDAWLEFNIVDGYIRQTATFRPRGIAGRLYWYSVWAFHGFVFQGMAKSIANAA